MADFVLRCESVKRVFRFWLFAMPAECAGRRLREHPHDLRAPVVEEIRRPAAARFKIGRVLLSSRLAEYEIARCLRLYRFALLRMLNATFVYIQRSCSVRKYVASNPRPIYNVNFDHLTGCDPVGNLFWDVRDSAFMTEMEINFAQDMPPVFQRV